MNDKTISLNCPSCGPLAARINEAKLDPHRQYAPMIKDLTALEQRGIIELLAASNSAANSGWSATTSWKM